MTTRPRTLLLAVAVATALGAGGVAAATTNPTPKPTGDSSAQSTAHPRSGHAHAGHRHAGRFGRGLHGEFVVRAADGVFRTVGTQRGDVTAVSPTSVTLRSADGFVRTYAVTSSSRVRSAGTRTTITTIAVGAHAGAVATKVGDAWQLRLLVARAH